MTNAEYHAAEGLSKSDLDLIHKSPAYYRYIKENKREQTASMLLGSVFHKLVLEPETFAAEYAVCPAADRRTRAGKELYRSFVDSLHESVEVITDDVYQTAYAMAEALKNHPIASKLLTNGKAERSFFTEFCGVKIKCRPDWLRNDGIVVDLKSTQNASPDKFPKSAYDFRYHVQAWWYLNALRTVGIEATDFMFIAVENIPPYHVCVFAADDIMLALGENDAKADLAVYKKCLESGNWHGYEEKIHSLSPPAWALKRGELSV